MPLKLDLVDVLQSHSDTLKDEIWTGCPAVVISLGAPGFVNVQPLINNPLLDEDGNVAGSEPLKPIENVPLAIVRGAGAMVSVPVVPGDNVFLMFSKHSMDTYRIGSGATPQDPGWVGKHTYDSCVAFPCIAPDIKAPVDWSPTDIVVGFDGAEAQVRVNAAGISLGKTATDFVALASKVDAALSAIVSAFNGHTHAIAGVQTGSGAVVSAVPAPESPPSPTGSTFVRCE